MKKTDKSNRALIKDYERRNNIPYNVNLRELFQYMRNNNIPKDTVTFEMTQKFILK